MIKMSVFKKVKKSKKKGLSKTEISKTIGLDPKTVAKYWDMSKDEYREYINTLQYKEKVFEPFKDDILDVYRHNDNQPLIGTAVYDYLEEKHGKLPGKEQCFRRYIDYLIETNQLNLDEKIRLYKSVPELPYGRQLQIDLGEFTTKEGLKLYIFAGVLSASRYKYADVQTKPFTTRDMINHLLNCFEYIGGCPMEIVIDQDSTMVVSENHGDIIYTRDFLYFKEEMGFKMYVCRKRDPESKGKIENLIKYIKYNFFNVRWFESEKEVRERLREWLRRRANGKISMATKKIPAELIEEERKHLLPLKNSIYQKESILGREPRIVDDKSYISVAASNYSVPCIYKNKEVSVFKTDSTLFIFDPRTGEQITEHKLSAIPNSRIFKQNHFRTYKSMKPVEMKDELLRLFDIESWKTYIEQNYSTFTRYFRDQYKEAKKYFGKDINKEYMIPALDLCLENKTYTMANLHDAYIYYQNLPKSEDTQDVLSDIKPYLMEISQYKKDIKVKKRSLQVYKSITNIVMAVIL